MGCGGRKSEPIPQGDAAGQMLQWDVATSAWRVQMSPTILGQRPYWNQVTLRWEARDASGFAHVWGSLNMGNVVSAFYNASTFESGGGAAYASSGVPVGGAVLATRLAMAWFSAGPPSDCTSTIFVNNVSTGVSVLSPVASLGPHEAIISLAIAPLSTIGLGYSLAGATDLVTRRPRGIVRGQSNV